MFCAALLCFMQTYKLHIPLISTFNKANEQFSHRNHAKRNQKKIKANIYPHLRHEQLWLQSNHLRD